MSVTPMSSSSNDTAHIIVSVVGFNAHGSTYSSSREGVGKSCLCSRFRYPGFDDYVPDHPSLLAFHEFESQVVSTDSFLYWGPEEALYTARGSKQGKAKEIKVKHEVLEHTVFYQDETSRPFRQHSKLLEPAAYAKKVAQTPESSRKISYYARDAIGFPDRYTCLPYPSNPNKLQRGFIIAVDISLEGPRFEQQFTAVESIAYELRKSPVIIAATKRDIACQASLARLSEWAAKQKLALIETSAKENINVSDAFRLVASKVLPKRINDHYMDYAGATGELITKRAAAKKELKSYLKTYVHTSSISLASLEATKQYQNGLNMLGKFTSDEIVCCHLLVVRNHEIEGFSGVKENPDMRLELLEDFIDSQTDFNAHKGMLNTMANHLVNPEQAVYANEGVGNSHFHHLLPSPMIERKKNPTPSHNETEVLINQPQQQQQQQQQQQPTSPGKYVRLVSQPSDTSVTGSSTSIDSPATSNEEDEETPLPTTQVGQAFPIEEVYDDFTTPEGGTSEDTSLLSMKERAALLKKQFQGQSVAVNECERPMTPPIQPPIQSKEPFTSSSAGSSPAANKRLATKRPPPAVPSKPSNYQKHKIKGTAPPPPPNEAASPDPVTGLSEAASGPALPNKTQTSSSQHSLETSPQQFIPNEQHLTRVQLERQTDSTLQKQDSPAAKHRDILKLERQDSPLEDMAQSKLDKSKLGSSLEDILSVKDKLQGPQQISESKSPLLGQRRKNYETKEIPERKNYEKTKPVPPPPTTKPKRNDYEPKLPKLRQKHGITSGTPTTPSDNPPATNVTQSLPVTANPLPPPPPPPPPPQFVSAVDQPLPPPPPQAYPQPFSPPTKDTMSSPIHSMSMMSPPLDSSPTVVSHYPPPLLSPPHSMVSPSSSVHFSPHSSVVSSPSHSVSSVQAVNTPHGRSPSPPPIPPHTAAMLKPRESESVKPSKRHNYFNIFKKLTSDSSDNKSKPDDKPPANNNRKPDGNSGQRRKTQVDMTRRPLPMEPAIKPVHDEDEYEKPDTFFERPRMPLPGESPSPYPPSMSLPGQQYPVSVDPRLNSPFMVDPRFADPRFADPRLADPRVPGFDPLVMTTRNPYPYVIPTASVPASFNPLWSTPNWFANRPSEQLLINEHFQRLQAQQSNVPKRSQSFQVTGSRRVNLDDNVDEDGYQNPDVVEDIRRERDLPSQWSVGPQQLPGRSIDYDYPELRGFRTVPRRSPQRSNPERPLPSRKPPRPLQKEDSYVNMDESSLSDDYQNSDIIKSMTDFVPQVKLPPRSKGGSMDDSFLYYNMKRRNILSPPLSPQRSMLPPRGSEQKSEDQEIGISPPSMNPTLVQQQRNSSPSLPPSLPAKSRSPAMSHSFSTSSIESGSSVPPLSSIPPLPSKDIKDLPPLPSKPESPGIDEETGQKKKLKLPPRNIPRPGFNNKTIQQQEYTTII